MFSFLMGRAVHLPLAFRIFITLKRHRFSFRVALLSVVIRVSAISATKSAPPRYLIFEYLLPKSGERCFYNQWDITLVAYCDFVPKKGCKKERNWYTGEILRSRESYLITDVLRGSLMISFHLLFSGFDPSSRTLGVENCCWEVIQIVLGNPVQLSLRNVRYSGAIFDVGYLGDWGSWSNESM